MSQENVSTKVLYKSLSQTINNEYIDVNKKMEYVWTFFNKDINEKNTHNQNSIEFNIKISKINENKEYYKYDIKHINSDDTEDDKYIFLHYILESKSDIENYNLEEEISKHLRKSKSFEINDDNSYRNDYFLFAVSEKGIALCSYDKDARFGKTRHSRFLTLYLLAIAYNLKIEQFLEDGAEIYKNYISKKDDKNMDGIKDIIDFRESIYAFDLQYFFENPVKIDRYEAYMLWEIIAKCYRIKHRHDEIKNQVLSLTEIIVKNKDQELKKYENERKQQISIIGLLVSIVPIIIELVESVTWLRTYKNIILLIILFGLSSIFFYMFVHSKHREQKIKQ